MPHTPHILIVDDEPWNITVLEKYLKDQGYRVTGVNSGSAALAEVTKTDFDMILLDIMMPTMDGYEVCRKLRDQPACATLPIILVTALRETADKVTGLDAGADDFLTKPVDKSELSARVRAHLRIKSMSDELKTWNEQLEVKVDQRTHEVKAKGRQLSDAYHMVLEVLANSLDVRERETGKHSLRVAYFTVELAKHLDIGGIELEEIAMGALLHDIGKIGVPDSVLLKPGKLTAEEWDEMRKHPETGYTMLRQIEFIGKGRDVVLCHQERFDGKGYPGKLKAGEIYIGARCFCLADTLDAMLSKRPYKDALPYSKVVEEVKRCSGSQFDPAVAEVFLKIPERRWQELREIAETGDVRHLMKDIISADSLLQAEE